MRFVVLTKTLWTEAPRLRHQVTRMLASRGHEIDFVERNRWLGRMRSERRDGLRFVRHAELVHHQLRVARPLSWLNARVESRALRRLGLDAPNTVLLNFNYDHYFLRAIAPRTPIITFVNDDFVAAARWFVRGEAERVFGLTLARSDHTLVVSTPLLAQARRHTDRVSLFLPWARRQYARPAEGLRREDLLYWGYVNERMDLPALRALMDSGRLVHFVGPVSESAPVRALLSHENARSRGAGTLDEISEVLARCCASVVAYDASHPQVRAVTASNRAFDLLAAGLPLLYTDLPGLLDAPARVIRRCRSPEDFIRAAAEAAAVFDESQPEIETFLRAHTETERYGRLLAVVAESVERSRARVSAS